MKDNSQKGVPTSDLRANAQSPDVAPPDVQQTSPHMTRSGRTAPALSRFIEQDF